MWQGDAGGRERKKERGRERERSMGESEHMDEKW
jgi:hypothetical protein